MWIQSIQDSSNDARNRFNNSYELHEVKLIEDCNTLTLLIYSDIPINGHTNPLAQDGIVSMGDIKWNGLGIKFISNNDSELSTGVYYLPKFVSHAHRNDGINHIDTNLSAGVWLTDVKTSYDSSTKMYSITMDKKVIEYMTTNNDSIHITMECANDVIAGTLKLSTALECASEERESEGDGGGNTAIAVGENTSLTGINTASVGGDGGFDDWGLLGLGGLGGLFGRSRNKSNDNDSRIITVQSEGTSDGRVTKQQQQQTTSGESDNPATVFTNITLVPIPEITVDNTIPLVLIQNEEDILTLGGYTNIVNSNSESNNNNVNQNSNANSNANDNTNSIVSVNKNINRNTQSVNTNTDISIDFPDKPAPPIECTPSTLVKCEPGIDNPPKTQRISEPSTAIALLIFLISIVSFTIYHMARVYCSNQDD